MQSRINLRRMGLRKFRPLRGDHPEIGHPCLLCKRPIQAGDEIGHVPQHPDGRESATLVAHWKCIEDGFNGLRGSQSAAPGTTSDFLEFWAGAVKDDAADSEFPYASQAYVEGYAINPWVARHPVAHAWCVDPEGFVVDTTWDEGVDYFGVPFRMEYVRRRADARKDYGLIDNEEMGFPLLTGAHRSEERRVGKECKS